MPLSAPSIRMNSELNAVVIWFDRARAQAEASTVCEPAATQRHGAFAGVPFLLKDLGASPDFRSRAATGRYHESLPLSKYDSTLVARFHDARTHHPRAHEQPRLGGFPVPNRYGVWPNRNPWNADRTPGGSSGGRGFRPWRRAWCDVAHASDGGGSIRMPASSGLYGLKPTQGRVTMGPTVTSRASVTPCCSAAVLAYCCASSMRCTAQGIGDTVVAPATPVRGRTALRAASPPYRAAQSHPLVARCTPTASWRCRRQRRCRAGPRRVPRSSSGVEVHGPRSRFMAMWPTDMATGINTLGASIEKRSWPDDVGVEELGTAQFAKQVTGVVRGGAGRRVRNIGGACRWWADGWGPAAHAHTHGTTRSHRWHNFTTITRWQGRAGPASSWRSRRRSTRVGSRR